MSLPLLSGAVAPAPASGWTVRTAGEVARAALSDAPGGILLVDFDIAPDTPARSGHEVFMQSWADILLDEPIELAPDTERIVLETRLSPVARDTSVLFLPLIRDSQGETLLFRTMPFPHMKGSADSWRDSMTPCFYSGEAGAPTHEVFEIVGDPVDFAPTGRLSLLGFRLLLRQENMSPGIDRRRRGTLALGGFSQCGQVIGYFHPYAHADALLGDSPAGEYTVATRVLDEFQGVPLAESKTTFRYDPSDPDSRRRRIEFALGPDGNYWIECQVTDSGGAVVAARSARQQVLGNAGAPPLGRVDTRSAPSIGVMRVNPDHPGRGVYSRGETPEIELRLFPKPGQTLRVEWRAMPCDAMLSDVLDSGEASAAAPGRAENGAPREHTEENGAPREDAAPVSVAISPSTTPDRDAYRLLADVYDGARKVDSREYFFGFRTDPAARHDREGRIADRREMKRHPYNRTTYVGRGDVSAPWTEAAALSHFRAYMAESRGLATSITHMIDLRDFEVLPGVFDFHFLDLMMDAAADEGFKMTIRLAHCDHDGRDLYRWPKYSRQYCYDGTIAEGHAYYGAYSVLDPGTESLWLRAYRALFDRYRAHTAFEGYYIMQPGGEWTVVDQPWNGTVTGYDPATARGFRDWLRERFPLDELNARWGASFAGFDEIEPPMPDFRSGAAPDLRMQWIDFCRFKDDLNAEWMRRAVRSIRSYDDDRVTISYGAPNLLAEVLGGQLDYGHNGGNHYGDDLGMYIDAWKRFRVGWITEPHHPYFWAAHGDTPNRGWVLDWSVWVMTAQAGGGGSNLHVYYFPRGADEKALDIVGCYGGIQAYDSFERFKPVLAELHEVDLVMPPAQVAFGADPTTLYAKHRTTFGARLDDLRRWRELLEADSVPYEEFVAANAANYRLVLPNPLDEVISAESLDRYVSAVRAGARLVIFANTGKYAPERGNEPFALLRALGIEPPSAPYDRKGQGVAAAASAGNPLFEEGASIPFITGDDLHAQLESAEIRERFWEYPYRFIPETDYFGRYPGVEVGDGAKAIAHFDDGGVAMSLHNVGDGEAIVFWGTPDMGIGGRNLKGMMARAAEWAGVENPLVGNPVRRYLEGRNEALGRHYLVLYMTEPGTYAVPVPHAPDGSFFVDDAVCGERIGLFSGAALRSRGIELTWRDGFSPLKVIRMIPESRANPAWARAYRVEE